MNKDKVEVILTVSQTPPANLIMQLSTIFDKFECAFSDQNSLVASVITHLEKVEGKRVVNNIPNHNIPQVDSRGALHSTMSATAGASSEEPMYGMLAGFIRDNHRCLNRPRLNRPRSVQPPYPVRW
jgi:hypothetical protein